MTRSSCPDNSRIFAGSSVSFRRLRMSARALSEVSGGASVIEPAGLSFFLTITPSYAQHWWARSRVARRIEAHIGLDPLVLIKGKLPRRALELVLDWAELHAAELRENWDRGQRH